MGRQARLLERGRAERSDRKSLAQRARPRWQDVLAAQNRRCTSAIARGRLGDGVAWPGDDGVDSNKAVKTGRPLRWWLLLESCAERIDSACSERRLFVKKASKDSSFLLAPLDLTRC